jgi:hypothetical protein
VRHQGRAEAQLVTAREETLVGTTDRTAHLGRDGNWASRLILPHRAVVSQFQDTTSGSTRQAGTKRRRATASTH